MFICFFEGGFAVAGVRAGAAGFGAAFTSAAFGAAATTLGVLRSDCTGADVAGGGGFGAAFASATFGAAATTLGVLRSDCTGAGADVAGGGGFGAAFASAAFGSRHDAGRAGGRLHRSRGGRRGRFRVLGLRGFGRFLLLPQSGGGRELGIRGRGFLGLRFGGLRGFVEAQALPGHFGDQ
ncbi:hypothetical protein DIPPA_27540 [Diplonema papillatum]|nr:hypothetical protein DIPPA_27540 [Diplonema papillatum]